jgi:hypothetical protein
MRSCDAAGGAETARGVESGLGLGDRRDFGVDDVRWDDGIIRGWSWTH